MANLFTEENIPKEVILPSLWKDPITDLEVPKRAYENLVWRRAMLEAAQGDRGFQQALYTACSKSLLFFINAFVYTAHSFEVVNGLRVQSKFPISPFCSWPRQDEWLKQHEQCLDEGGDILTEKSRDVGITVCAMALLSHRLLFRRYQSLLCVSRKENAVDMLSGLPVNYPYGPIAGEHTLFGKIDLILANLPKWMLPSRIDRKTLHIVNTDTNSRIDGESSNNCAGTGERRTCVFLDEFAKVDGGEDIKTATRDVAASRFVVSTPYGGSGNPFSKWRFSGQIPVFTMAWWHSPDKSKGLTSVKRKDGLYEVTSLWRENEKLARSPQELAQEVDIDHAGAAAVFFEPEILEQHKIRFAKPPYSKWSIGFDEKLSDRDIYRSVSSCRLSAVVTKPDSNGELKIWTHLIDGRPDQIFTYTIGADIGKGQGASNSTLSILCNETGEKIGEFASAKYPPFDFAKISLAVCLWIGGRNRRPLLVPENNGDAGFDYTRQVAITYAYGNLYFDKRAGTIGERVGKRYGWRSNKERKAQALGLLRRAYALSKFFNHSAEAIDEAKDYITFTDGSIGPSGLVTESSSARSTHGDRVIADMMAVWGGQDNLKFKQALQKTDDPYTMQGRQYLAQQERNKESNKQLPQFSRLDSAVHSYGQRPYQ